METLRKIKNKKTNETTRFHQIYTDDSTAVILRAKPEACPERSEGTNKTLHFVQGDTPCQILHFVQNDISCDNLVLISWFLFNFIYFLCDLCVSVVKFHTVFSSATIPI